MTGPRTIAALLCRHPSCWPQIAAIQEQVNALTDEELLDPRSAKRLHLISTHASSVPNNAPLDAMTTSSQVRARARARACPRALTAHAQGPRSGARARRVAAAPWAAPC